MAEWRPVLHEDMCERDCPAGFIRGGLNGVCAPCAAPCLNCFGTPDFCMPRPGPPLGEPCPGDLYYYLHYCHFPCPAGTAPMTVPIDADGDGITDYERGICVLCTGNGCSVCDPYDVGTCIICLPPLVLHEGKCAAGCPQGWIVNALVDKASCRPWTYNDLEVIPFPYLTLAFILCFIACCGKCKKKTIRDKRISTQNTITCFLVCIAFVQFLAVLGLIVWAFLFETWLLFFIAIGILVLLLLLNWVFQCIHGCVFNRTITPKDKYRKYKEGKISKAELSRYIVPKDELFDKHKRKHWCCFCCISCSTCCCTFKCNKAYYSHCFMFDVFKGRWSQAKYYRKLMTCFTIVEIVIDALIICVCVAFLLTMELFENQLVITVFELAVLSLLLILFALIELCMLKQYLRYNERDIKKKRFDV